MRAVLGLVVVVILAVVVASALGLIDIRQTKTGKLPEVHADGGKLPGFAVKTADISVGTTNTTVEVPTVNVKKAH